MPDRTLSIYSDNYFSNLENVIHVSLPVVCGSAAAIAGTSYFQHSFQFSENQQPVVQPAGKAVGVNVACSQRKKNLIAAGQYRTPLGTLVGHSVLHLRASSSQPSFMSCGIALNTINARSQHAIRGPERSEACENLRQNRIYLRSAKRNITSVIYSGLLPLSSSLVDLIVHHLASIAYHIASKFSLFKYSSYLPIWERQLVYRVRIYTTGYI